MLDTGNGAQQLDRARRCSSNDGTALQRRGVAGCQADADPWVQRGRGEQDVAQATLPWSVLPWC